MKYFVLVLIIIILLALILNEFNYDKYPYNIVAKKEVKDSWIPGLKRYYLYDANQNRYKVNEEIYKSFTLWWDGVVYTNEEGKEQLLRSR